MESGDARWESWKSTWYADGVRGQQWARIPDWGNDERGRNFCSEAQIVAYLNKHQGTDLNGDDLDRCPDAGCAAAHAANVYKPNHCQYRERGYYMATTAYSKSLLS